MALKFKHLDFVDKYSPYTKRFEAYVSLLCEKVTLIDAASVADIDWKQRNGSIRST